MQIELSDVDKRKKVLVTKDIGIKDLFPAGLGEEPDSVGDGVKDDRLPLYFDGENVSGKVGLDTTIFLRKRYSMEAWCVVGTRRTQK